MIFDFIKKWAFRYQKNQCGNPCVGHPSIENTMDMCNFTQGMYYCENCERFVLEKPKLSNDYIRGIFEE